VNWRLQITADGEAGSAEVFSFDDAVAFIGWAMGLALAQGHNLSIEIEPLAPVAEPSPQGLR
jgi:hypothetical protein